LAAVALAVLVSALGGCHVFPSPAGQAPEAGHYVVGPPYRAGGVWRYPQAQFDYAATGIAEVIRTHPPLTADGEHYDADALAAAHPTLQLPAMVRVTNLATGRQVVVRLNDRGPASPARLLAVTPRVAALLGAAGQAAFPVRVEVLEAESRRLAAQSGDQAPALPVAAVPLGAVKAEALPPPPGARSGGGAVVAALPQPAPRSAPAAAIADVSLNLTGKVVQVPVRPWKLYIDAGAFSRLEYAEIRRARLAGLGAQTITSYGAPSEPAYRVRIGPLASISQADATLDRVLRAGVTDARIVAE
jgi:rare lipoprotein A